MSTCCCVPLGFLAASNVGAGGGAALNNLTSAITASANTVRVTHNIGTASADRLVFINVFVFSNAGGDSFSGWTGNLTVGGAPASYVVSGGFIPDSNGDNYLNEIWYVEEASTTGDAEIVYIVSGATLTSATTFAIWTTNQANLNNTYGTAVFQVRTSGSSDGLTVGPIPGNYDYAVGFSTIKTSGATSAVTNATYSGVSIVNSVRFTINGEWYFAGHETAGWTSGQTASVTWDGGSGATMTLNVGLARQI